MTTEALVTADLLIGDVIFLLQCLDQRKRDAESMVLLDVRQILSPAVTLAFSDYLRFLRRYGYVVFNIDDRSLRLTPQGETALVPDRPLLASQLKAFFPDKMYHPIAEVLARGEVPIEETPNPANLLSVPPVSTPGLASEPIYARGDPLGHGPVGAVYKALHSTLGVEVAIKEFNGPFVARVRAHAPDRLRDLLARQSRLHHPAIVAVYDLDQAGQLPVAAIELCDGGSMRGALSSLTRPTTPVLLRAFAQLLDALALAQENDLCHGNLKAENMLFDRFGNARVADFGLAALREPEGPEDARLLGYLAPELGNSAAEPTPAADVYAAGVLLFEIFGGRQPNRRASFPNRLGDDAPPTLIRVAQRMVSDSPAERYHTVIEALRDYLRALGPQAPGEPGRISFATRTTLFERHAAPQSIT